MQKYYIPITKIQIKSNQIKSNQIKNQNRRDFLRTTLATALSVPFMALGKNDDKSHIRGGLWGWVIATILDRLMEAELAGDGPAGATANIDVDECVQCEACLDVFNGSWEGFEEAMEICPTECLFSDEE